MALTWEGPQGHSATCPWSGQARIGTAPACDCGWEIYCNRYSFMRELAAWYERDRRAQVDMVQLRQQLEVARTEVTNFQRYIARLGHLQAESIGFDAAELGGRRWLRNADGTVTTELPPEAPADLNEITPDPPHVSYRERMAGIPNRPPSRTATAAAQMLEQGLLSVNEARRIISPPNEGAVIHRWWRTNPDGTVTEFEGDVPVGGSIRAPDVAVVETDPALEPNTINLAKYHDSLGQRLRALGLTNPFHVAAQAIHILQTLCPPRHEAVCPCRFCVATREQQQPAIRQLRKRPIRLQEKHES